VNLSFADPKLYPQPNETPLAVPAGKPAGKHDRTQLYTTAQFKMGSQGSASSLSSASPLREKSLDQLLTEEDKLSILRTMKSKCA